MSEPQPTQVKVGYLQLNDNERREVTMDQEAIKSVLVQGFRDEIDSRLKAAREQWERETDPRTRPGYSGDPPQEPDTLELDIKRFGRLKRAVVAKATGDVIRWMDVDAMRDTVLSADLVPGASKGGWLPPMTLSDEERETISREFADYVSDRVKNGNAEEKATFSVLKFPRGDLENFSICRWAMACEQANNTSQGTSAYAKHAPWESSYYSALQRYASTKGDTWLKAQGDMISGQDGGFLN